jgi:uncharacterized protein (TIGR03437 family)
VEAPPDCQVLHAASYRTGLFAPGQIVTIFGSDFSAASSLEVLVSEAPAHVLYVGEKQINAQIPNTVAAGVRAELRVLDGVKTHCRAAFDIARAAPGIFTTQAGAGQAIAVNEDGALNSKDSPAQRGAIVVLYATGEGVTQPALPVDVRVGGLPAQVLCAGPAPGFIGLMQINIRTPGGFAPAGILPLELFVDSAVSQPGVTIAVR